MGKKLILRFSGSKVRGEPRERQLRSERGNTEWWLVRPRSEVGYLAGWVSFVLLFCVPTAAQTGFPPPPAPEPQTASPSDILGRTPPRGRVLGFLKAAHKGDYEVAAQYLNTQRRGKAATDLAHQLFVVMDRLLPARLNELSNSPEGSLAFPAKPDQDLVGTISSESGNTDILLERVDRGKAGRLWLFSGRTLESVPNLYAGMNVESPGSVPSAFLTRTRIGGIPLVQWIAFFAGLPLSYLAMVL